MFDFAGMMGGLPPSAWASMSPTQGGAKPQQGYAAGLLGGMNPSQMASLSPQGGGASPNMGGLVQSPASGASWGGGGMSGMFGSGGGFSGAQGLSPSANPAPAPQMDAFGVQRQSAPKRMQNNNSFGNASRGGMFGRF